MTIDTRVDEYRRRHLALYGLIACGAGFAVKHALAADSAGDRSHVPAEDTLESALHGGFRRSEVACDVPKVNLIRQDGSLACFPEELDDGWSLVVTFFRTYCSSSCRLNSRILAEVQNRLGTEVERARFLSISTDPVSDTPERLREYAAKIGAQDQWQFYTGSPEACAALRTAFNVDHADKAAHTPVTFLRGAPCYKWVRLDGFAHPEALLREFQSLAKLAV